MAWDFESFARSIPNPRRARRIELSSNPQAEAPQDALNRTELDDDRENITGVVSPHLHLGSSA